MTICVYKNIPNQKYLNLLNGYKAEASAHLVEGFLSSKRSQIHEVTISGENGKDCNDHDG